MHALFQDTLRLLRDKTFDVTAFQNAMEQHAVISKARQSEASALLTNQISLMNIDKRSAYADRLESALKRQKRQKIKKLMLRLFFKSQKIFVYLVRRGSFFVQLSCN